MRKKTRIACVLVFVSLVSGPARAVSTITSLVGDKDGFGIGLSAGQEFYFGAIPIVGSDPYNTDVRLYGPWSETHAYDLVALDGPVTSAVLEIFHGSDGSGGPSEVFLNGTFVGLLTDSERSPYTTYPSIASRDTLDITAYAGLLTGSDTVQVKPARDGDGWVMDYAELRLATSQTGGTIPAPGAALLAVVGTGLVGSLRRRRAL